MVLYITYSYDYLALFRTEQTKRSLHWKIEIQQYINKTKLFFPYVISHCGISFNFN